MNIIKPLENEKYTDYIQRILCDRENKKDEKEYMEKHHITPKCMGGSNSKSNLIWLYAQEHYFTHELLARENPHNKSLAWAWWNMSNGRGKNGQERYKVNANQYSDARKNFVKNVSGENHPFFGKTMSEETKQKMIATKKINPYIMPQAEKDRRSKQMQGSNNPFYNKKHSDGTIKKIKEAHNIPVVCINTGIQYESAAQVERELGIDHTSISDVCRGKFISAGKDENGEPLKWKYADESLNQLYQPRESKSKKKIKCITTGEIFDKMRDACNKYNIAPANMTKNCQGKIQCCHPRGERNISLKFIFCEEKEE